MTFKRLFLALLLAAGLVAPAAGSGLYPLSNFQQFDSNGKLLTGARLFLFDGGTTNPRVGYKDSALTTPHPNPILADSAGRLPLIYLDTGFYRQRLTTKTGTLIFDQDGIPVLTTAAGGSGTSVDPNSIYGTRDIKIRFDDQPLAGYVRLNGRTIGSSSSGATERANIDTQPLYEELWTFANITVTGGKGASAVADFNANKPLVLPDAAGRGLFGMDDLGAGSAARLSTVITGSTLPGASGGVQNSAITVAQIPAYSLAGSATGAISTSGVTGTESTLHNHTGAGATSGQSADHTHTGSGTTGGMNANNPHSHTAPGFGRLNQLQPGGSSLPNADITIGTSSTNIDHGHNYAFTTSGSSNDHSHTYSFTSSAESAYHTHNITATGTASLIASVSSGGSGAAFPTVPPALLLMIYIRL